MLQVVGQERSHKEPADVDDNDRRHQSGCFQEAISEGIILHKRKAGKHGGHCGIGLRVDQRLKGSCEPFRFRSRLNVCIQGWGRGDTVGEVEEIGGGNNRDNGCRKREREQKTVNAGPDHQDDGDHAQIEAQHVRDAAGSSEGSSYRRQAECIGAGAPCQGEGRKDETSHDVHSLTTRVWSVAGTSEGYRGMVPSLVAHLRSSIRMCFPHHNRACDTISSFVAFTRFATFMQIADKSFWYCT